LLESWRASAILIGLAILSGLAGLAPGFEKTQIESLGSGSGQAPPLTLIGVLVSKDASSSVAVLKNEASGSVTLLKVGEKVQGLELLEISRDRAILSDGSRVFELFLNIRAAVQTRAMPKKTAKLVAGEEDKSLNATSSAVPVEKEFFKSEIETRIRAELPKILKESQLVPHFGSGGIDGVQIVRWLPGSSLLSDIGIREGDIIKQVNEIRLDSPSALFRLQRAVLQTRHFDVLVERDGKFRRYSYILKDPPGHH
jgi:general secretion pathway protein C